MKSKTIKSHYILATCLRTDRKYFKRRIILGETCITIQAILKNQI